MSELADAACLRPVLFASRRKLVFPSTVWPLELPTVVWPMQCSSLYTVIVFEEVATGKSGAYKSRAMKAAYNCAVNV